jgi:hypothetical protein
MSSWPCLGEVYLPLRGHGLIKLISNREKQLKTTIKKWQIENPVEWPPIPKPKPGRSKSNPCECHIHCDLKSGVCYSLYHNEAFNIENARSEPQSLQIVLVSNSFQAIGRSKLEYVHFTISELYLLTVKDLLWVRIWIPSRKPTVAL